VTGAVPRSAQPPAPAAPRAPGGPAGSLEGDLAISIAGLRKRYGDLTVLDGLDLEVPHGSLVALLGPNGAGKTTTVEILEGYRRPDGGRVRVLGLDPHRDGAALRPRIGVMLQQGGITPQGRPRELVRLYARFYAHPADPDELLELLGLAHAANRRFKLLSGGEKQRLALALALVGRPQLLVLDEPTAGMDPAAKAQVRQLIADLRAAGRTILLTTHELADVERLADHVVVIDRGRVLAAGTPAELVAGANLVLRFRIATLEGRDARLDAADLASLGAGLGGPIEADGAAGRHRLGGGATPGPATVSALATWCAERGLLLAELRTTGGTLEERFLELLTEPSDAEPGPGGAGSAAAGGAGRRTANGGPGGAS
jgi:ABC-2 type transport system ATP-binding protein